MVQHCAIVYVLLIALRCVDRLQANLSESYIVQHLYHILKPWFGNLTSPMVGNIISIYIIIYNSSQSFLFIMLLESTSIYKTAVVFMTIYTELLSLYMNISLIARNNMFYY